MLNYADVKKHAREIVEATGRRFMPPWLAADVGVKYVGEWRLTGAEITQVVNGKQVIFRGSKLSIFQPIVQ